MIYIRGFAACRDGAAPCEKTIREGAFEQLLHAVVHGICANDLNYTYDDVDIVEMNGGANWIILKYLLIQAVI